jgi:hypothetical protein
VVLNAIGDFGEADDAEGRYPLPQDSRVLLGVRRNGWPRLIIVRVETLDAAGRRFGGRQRETLKC